MRYDTLIIGAGMSGLAAGIRLAQFERRVAIVERHVVWGGLNSFYSLAGRRFDVGLHALTNFVKKGVRGAPLTRVLRQLRIPYDLLRLGEQGHSEIHVPGVRLVFTNDIERLQAEVARAFPEERDGFARLVAAMGGYAIDSEAPAQGSARALLSGYVRDPALVDALLLPTCYYGSAREDDVDAHTFAVLFKSLFLEGLARPEGGIRTLLNLLVKRYKAAGGELRMGNGVARVVLENGAAKGLVLDDGTELEAERVLSSAGWVETMRLAGRGHEVPARDEGRLSFLESISVLDRRPAELGIDAATLFFSNGERFRYRNPEELVDVSSGVLSSPNNYAAQEPPAEGMLRLTVLAHRDRWHTLPEEEYRAAKERCADAAIASVSRSLPDWRGHIVFRDVFTPRTIEKFTGHVGGSVYGSPAKRWDGRTPVEDLFLIGTDQGYSGVVGALVSGALMANRHALSGALGGTS